jgi:probable F420-dependent oxidoreductase
VPDHQENKNLGVFAIQADEGRSSVPPNGLRFGVGAPSTISSRRDLVDHAQFAESAGYSVVTFPDHFFLPLAPLIAAAVVAEVTSRLRVGTLLLAAGFRHPAILAKELATLDVLTEGRLEVGVGAGWMENEHVLAGLPFGPPRERLARLLEVTEILKRAWSSERLTYEGAHFHLRDVPCLPQPVQPGGPPLLIGGGMRQILTASARVADIVTIAPGAIGLAGTISDDPKALLKERSSWVHDAAAHDGRHPELHMLLTGVALCDDRHRGARTCLDELARDAIPGGMQRHEEVKGLLESPFFAIGTAQEIGDQLRWIRSEFGISYFSVREAAAREFSPVVESLAGT